MDATDHGARAMRSSMMYARHFAAMPAGRIYPTDFHRTRPATADFSSVSVNTYCTKCSKPWLKFSKIAVTLLAFA